MVTQRYTYLYTAKYLVPLLHVQTLFLHQPLHQLHTSSTRSIMKQSAAKLHICSIAGHIRTNEYEVTDSRSLSV